MIMVSRMAPIKTLASWDQPSIHLLVMVTVLVASSMHEVGRADAYCISASFAQSGLRTLLVWFVDAVPPVADYNGYVALKSREHGFPAPLPFSGDGEMLLPGKVAGLDVFFFGREVALIEEALASHTDSAALFSDGLHELASGYDHVVVAGYDARFGRVAAALLSSADTLVYAVDVEQYSLDEVGRLLVSASRLDRKSGKRLAIKAVYLRGYDCRLQSSVQIRDELEMIFRDRVLTTSLPLPEARDFRYGDWYVTLDMRAYHELAIELDRRLRSKDQPVPRRRVAVALRQ